MLAETNARIASASKNLASANQTVAETQESVEAAQKLGEAVGKGIRSLFGAATEAKAAIVGDTQQIPEKKAGGESNIRGISGGGMAGIMKVGGSSVPHVVGGAVRGHLGGGRTGYFGGDADNDLNALKSIKAYDDSASAKSKEALVENIGKAIAKLFPRHGNQH
jgi:hypothetical protein